jgi:quercetin 2,3-dioxygenase
MQTIFRSEQRGGANHGWLQAKHSFSFADWYDPSRMGFGVLRVINEDRVAPKTGFGTHGHRDMEILTYLLGGALWHKDSMGNGEVGGANAGVIRPGEIQRMSAGTGVMHSEFNHGDETTHLLQIWLLPRTPGGAPGYEQAAFAPEQVDGKLQLLAAPEPGGLVHINSDVKLYAGRFDGEQAGALHLAAGRLAYVHVARGKVVVNGTLLAAGDALQMSGASETQTVRIEQGQAAEVLVFDLGQPN